MLFVQLFVHLACLTFCLLSLPLGARGWLLLVIVALHVCVFIFKPFQSMVGNYSLCDQYNIHAYPIFNRYLFCMYIYYAQ